MSRLWSRKARQDHRARKKAFEDETMRGYQSEQNQLRQEHMRDQEIQRDIARLLLKNEGIEEPHKPNPMNCAPDPDRMADAAEEGAWAGGIGAGIASIVSFAGGGYGKAAALLFTGVTTGAGTGTAIQLKKDVKESNQCLKEQENKYQEAQKHYEEQLKKKNPSYGVPFSTGAEIAVKDGGRTVGFKFKFNY